MYHRCMDIICRERDLPYKRFTQISKIGTMKRILKFGLFVAIVIFENLKTRFSRSIDELRELQEWTPHQLTGFLYSFPLLICTKTCLEGMYLKKFVTLLLALLAITQSQGVSGCGGSIKASPAIMKYWLL